VVYHATRYTISCRGTLTEYRTICGHIGWEQTSSQTGNAWVSRLWVQNFSEYLGNMKPVISFADNWMVLCHSELSPIFNVLSYVLDWDDKNAFYLMPKRNSFFLDHARYIEIVCYGTGLATLISLRHSELKSWQRWLLMYIVQGVEEKFVEVTTLTVMKKV
jgi:hypothetical protein